MWRSKGALASVFAAIICQLGEASAQTLATQAQEIARGVHLLQGQRVPDRGPDGNTVVFDAPQGLVVVDTGRHEWHSDAILAFARDRDRPIAAIINTHWHLDHSSGNGRLKAAFPQARVFATNAIDRALAEGGFLARDAANIPSYLAEPDVTDTTREEIAIFAATMANSAILRPDVVINRSKRMRIAGRPLDVRVTDRAVTDADIWLYDRRTRTAVIGDLVTMPVPYFETACPEQWRTALDEVWATRFRIVIPGHGAPMTRDEFNTYRTAFSAFVDCVNSSAEVSVCGDLWGTGVASLLGDDQARRERVSRGVEYYVAMLREHGGRSADCMAR